MVGMTVQMVSSSQFPLISEGSGFLLRRYLIANQIIRVVTSSNRISDVPRI